MIRFGKSNAEYIKLKSYFFDTVANGRYLAFERAVREKYCAQPPRLRCVVCDDLLGQDQMILRGVRYSLCSACGHFNGAREDTAEFVQFVYSSSVSKTAAVYGDAELSDYRARVEAIYRPKVRFMIDALAEQDLLPKHLTYVDLGSGGGHFVKAMRDEGLVNSFGYETDAELVEHTNRLLSSNLLRFNELDELPTIARTTETDVFTMIFALEHVRRLRDFVAAIRSNPRVRWFYFAVPMFNPSILIEGLFPELMTRSVGMGHTHLFTESSLRRLCQDFGLRRVAEWWFGGNAFDLYRIIRVKLGSDPLLGSAGQIWDAMMLPMIDGLQKVFDEKRLSSEVHLLTEIVQ